MILLVDRQVAVAEAFAQAWSAAGMGNVQVAASFANALALVSASPCEMVAASLSSGGTSLAEVAQLKLAQPNLKIIVLDDAVVDAHAQEALRLELSGYLTKEQPLADVMASLRRARNGERVFIPTIAARLILGGDGLRLEPLHQQGPLSRLTPRERDVLVHVAQGNSVKRCAELLGISPSTVDNHKSRLMRKLHVHKAVELTHFAIREGLIRHPIAATRPR